MLVRAPKSLPNSSCSREVPRSVPASGALRPSLPRSPRSLLPVVAKALSCLQLQILHQPLFRRPSLHRRQLNVGDNFIIVGGGTSFRSVVLGPSCLGLLVHLSLQLRVVRDECTGTTHIFSRLRHIREYYRDPQSA